MSTSETQGIHAIVVVTESAKAAGISEHLARRGITATIKTDPEEVLISCRSQSPHLVIVDDNLGTMSAARFLAELLKISWTTSSILICDEDEDVVHEKTEGLGILGSVRTVDDSQGLQKLVDKFLTIGGFGR